MLSIVTIYDLIDAYSLLKRGARPLLTFNGSYDRY